MTIREMHYDLKVRLNKLDSSQYRNIRIPEIDRKLNEAANLLVRSIAFPRIAENIGFEKNQRTIDDIRTIVVDDFTINTTTTDNISFYATLPALSPKIYEYYIDSKAMALKGSCTLKPCDVIIRRHGDKHENSPFDESSFEWREVNAHFVGNTIRYFSDGTFLIPNIKLDFIKKMAYMHNAQDFPGATYTLPNGTVLTGFVNCELPDIIHSEVLDLAVLIISGEINTADLQFKMMKQQLNQ